MMCPERDADLQAFFDNELEPSQLARFRDHHVKDASRSSKRCARNYVPQPLPKIPLASKRSFKSA
jgi:hypothetical protein